MVNSICPLVSVVFTSYNHKKYLRKALESLLNQTYSNIEIIIVDDFSSDGSQQILKDYSNHSNVTLILQQINSGSYVKASNFGASFAKGEYIIFAQCDDFSEITQIEKLVGVFIKSPTVGVVFSKSYLINENSEIIGDDYNGREIKFKKVVKNSGLINGNKMKEFLSFTCVIPNLSAALIKRELFLETNGLSSDFLVLADWDFWIKLTEKTNFYYLNEPLNYFRQHNKTIRSSIKMKVQILEAYKMFYNHIKDFNLTNAQKRQLKLGAGAVWFSYIVENRKIWLECFMIVLKDTLKYEKFNFYYFILGIMKHVMNAIQEKLKL